MLRPLAILGTLAALLFAAAPAAATITPSIGGTPGSKEVILVSDSAGDTMTVRCEGGTAFVGAIALPPCGEISYLGVEGHGGNDAIDFSGVTPVLFPKLTRVNINGQEGTDTVTGSQLGDEIPSDELDSVDAAGGDDTIEQGKQTSGGPGDDLFRSSAGTADGGAGDDVFFEPGGKVTSLSGGAGYDSIGFDFGGLSAQAIPAEITLSDAAFRFKVIGFPIETPFAINSLEHVGMVLPNGSQSVDAGGFSGALDVDGRGGADTIVGGKGQNALRGGAGDDTLIGGPSSDLLDGGDGNDQLQSRDGKVDVDDCGNGADTATADTIDSLFGCETALLPSVPDTTAPDTTGLKGPGSVAKGKSASFKFTSSEAGSSFKCRVDKGKATTCSSPYKLKTAKLKTGKHTFSVFAVDAAGNADATPATKKFSVTAAPRRHRHAK